MFFYKMFLFLIQLPVHITYQANQKVLQKLIPIN